jgi:hypothetical protein
MFGSGCSCGMGVGVRLQDFEQQILEFLHGRHGDSGYASIPELLRAVATQDSGKGSSARLALLADLARSLDSFEELHRGR